MRLFRCALRGLLDLLAPPLCCACDAQASGVFCDACAQLVNPNEQAHLDDVPLVAAGAYEGPLSSAIVRFKYQGRAELAAPLAELLAPFVAELGVGKDTPLVPVPLHARRLAERGYNQAALLASALGARVGHSAAPRLLLRARETERQVGKSRTLRLTNAKSAFVLNRRAARPARVVLVDDVVTTGATVRACAQALALGGVQLAAVVALARARAQSG